MYCYFSFLLVIYSRFSKKKSVYSVSNARHQNKKVYDMEQKFMCQDKSYEAQIIFNNIHTILSSIRNKIQLASYNANCDGNVHENFTSLLNSWKTSFKKIFILYSL